MSTTIGNNPASLDLDIYQGTDFEMSITAKDSTGAVIDYTGWIAKSQIRESEQSVQPALTFSASSGLGPNGVIALSAASASTVSLYDKGKDYVWDCKLTSATRTDVICKGKVTVIPRVTR